MVGKLKRLPTLQCYNASKRMAHATAQRRNVKEINACVTISKCDSMNNRLLGSTYFFTVNLLERHFCLIHQLHSIRIMSFQQ